MAASPSAISAQAVVEYEAAGGRITDVVAFVMSEDAAEWLGTRARLIGVPIGPEASRRGEDGVPGVRLTLVEVAVGVAEGVLHVNMSNDREESRVGDALRRLVQGSPWEEDFALSALDILRLRVFADLWRRGHFVAFGSKFGVDFLVYRGHPSSCHSFAMVLVREVKTYFTTVDIVSHCRVAKMVRKEFLLATMRNTDIVYLSLDHAVLATGSSKRQQL